MQTLNAKFSPTFFLFQKCCQKDKRQMADTQEKEQRYRACNAVVFVLVGGKNYRGEHSAPKECMTEKYIL